jgi:hypothetical protein
VDADALAVLGDSGLISRPNSSTAGPDPGRDDAAVAGVEAPSG